MNHRLIGENLRKNNFDLIRLILAILVIYSHSYVILGKHKTEPLMIFTQNQIDLGSVAVDLFFIISGFLITGSWEHSKSNSEYLKKRALRILPGFVTAFLISILIIGPLASGNKEHLLNIRHYFSSLDIGRLFFDLFTLQTPQAGECFSWLPMGNSVNSSLWTIQYEFLCYLMIPFFAWLGLMKKKWRLFLSLIVLYVLLCLQIIYLTKDLENHIPEWLKELLNPINFLRFFVDFFLGACYYLFRDKIIRSNFLALLSAIVLIISCIWTNDVVLVLPITCSYLLFYFAFHPNIDFSQFAKKGDFSYGVYLYGWPAQQSVMYILYNYLDAHRLFFISLPLAFVAAYLSWHCIEKTFLKLKYKAL